MLDDLVALAFGLLAVSREKAEELINYLVDKGEMKRDEMCIRDRKRAGQRPDQFFFYRAFPDQNARQRRDPGHFRGGG